jgi:hypothetical protein
MAKHINDEGQFQSDKYPRTPPDLVPLKVTDPDAQALLWAYSVLHFTRDPEFANDLQQRLTDVGYVPPANADWTKPPKRTDRTPFDDAAARRREEARRDSTAEAIRAATGAWCQFTSQAGELLTILREGLDEERKSASEPKGTPPKAPPDNGGAR